MFKKIQRYVPFCVVLLSWPLAGVESVAKIARRMPQILTQIVASATPDNPRHSEGSMVQLKDGRILFAYTEYYGGESEDHSPAKIVGTYTSDHGRTWSPKFTLLKNIARENVMSVTLLRLRSGEIAFFYLHKNSSSDLKAYIKISRDEAKSWSAPVCVTPMDGYHVMNNDRAIQLKSGRILAPVASSPDFRKLDHWVSSVHYSDDLGKTWRKSNSEVDLPKRGAMEPGLIELRDGSVMMIIRTQMGSVYRSLSRDGGVTWTAGESMGLVAPVAPSTISRIPKTGDLLIVWNNAPDKRTPLTTAVSKDEGKTWQNIQNLECDPRFAYAYTSILFDGDWALLSYWVHQRTPEGHLISMKIAAMEVDWFYQ
jgi:sialidase-1